MVSIDNLSDAISAELTIYRDNVTNGLKREAKRSIKQLVRATKATAPVGHRTKHYRSSITSKVTEDYKSISCIWFVRGSDYRLSHLLERGHALRNGGRTSGTHFIEKASTPIVENYEKAVRRILENG